MLLCFAVQSQHSTLRFTDEPINLNNQSLLVIPFEEKMYLSDANSAIAINNNMTSQEILERFTSALDQSILYTFQEKCNVSSFYLLDDEEAESDLKYVYDNRKLEYELVSETVEKTKIEKLKGKIKKPADNSYQQGQIQNGQIITKRDSRKRYMKAVVEDKMVLDSLQKKFRNKFFLFVNELDLMNDYSDPIAVQRGEYMRNLSIHYTLYHRDGNILSTGISATQFPSNQNNINQIIEQYFPILAQQIFDDLFPPVEEEKGIGKKIGLKKWK